MGAMVHHRTHIFFELVQNLDTLHMKHLFFLISSFSLLLVGCVNPTPTPEPEPDPANTVYFEESNEDFVNPERGFMIQVYYESGDLNKKATVKSIQNNRIDNNICVYLHSYYLTDYMESDIPQEFLDRMEHNFKALREGGAKAVIRYSYKNNESNANKPWDTTMEWTKRHIDQLAPYWQEYTDVILCMQAGFIGVWGEWYYTSNFNMNPKTDEDYAPRWEIVDYILERLPDDRQLSLRTPTFKMRYLKMKEGAAAPLTESEAYQPTAKARLAAFNDCFLASGSDVGTYTAAGERDFWAADSKYTFMGGETCGKCGDHSKGPNAIKEMEEYHWTYIHRDYDKAVLVTWYDEQGSMDIIKRRLGYRFVLDKAFPTPEPKTDEIYQITLTLRNVGFASLHNPRAVELVMVSKNNPEEKYVYPQQIDPRFWEAGDTITTTLHGRLDKAMTGEYKVYLNMPDPYPTIHDNPAFSIRFANKDIWDEKTGYNYLTDLTLE